MYWRVYWRIYWKSILKDILEEYTEGYTGDLQMVLPKSAQNYSVGTIGVPFSNL